jgi:hypothetical protein
LQIAPDFEWPRLGQFLGCANGGGIGQMHHLHDNIGASVGA